MKLFYKPGACSLASHIILREVTDHFQASHFELERVDTEKALTENNVDFNSINPNGYVPALQLDSGEILTEGVSILQYLADRYPDSGLAPAAGTVARARLHEYLNYISSELHKAFTPFFTASASDADKQQATISVEQKLSYIERLLSDGRHFLLGDAFSVADAYLFVVINWAEYADININQWPAIVTFIECVKNRPATQAAMHAEGLLS